MAEGEETPDTRAVDPAGADAAASGEARPQDTPPDPSPDAAEDAAADPEVKPTTEEADGDVIEILVPPKKDTELPHPDSPVDIRRWMVECVSSRHALKNAPEIPVTDETEAALYPFFADSNRSILILWVEGDHIRMGGEMPTGDVPEMAYFLKTDHVTISPSDEFESKAHYGTLRGDDHIDSLVAQMELIYLPLFEDTAGWPHSVQSEFAARVNKFMSSINDMKCRKQNQAGLFFPREIRRITHDPTVYDDKEFVQRLETIMIQWTKQIQEVVAGLKGGEEASTPLAEIALWRNRCANISGLGSQLDDKRVELVTQMLSKTKSPYVPTFENWCTRIKDGITRAESNKQFLTVLEEPCTKIEAAEQLTGLKPLFYRVLNLIKMISIHAPYYNGTEQINSLVLQVTVSIIAKCSRAIDLNELFGGDVSIAVKQLEDAVQCCDEWASALEVACSLHENKITRGPAIEPSAVYAEVDAFRQRCTDLLDVCACIVHFGRREGREVAELPCVRGSFLSEVQQGFETIAAQFDTQLTAIQVSGGDGILNTKNEQWHDIYNIKFKAAVKDLEVMVQNLLTSSLRQISEVDAAIELLEIFEPLSTRDVVRRAFEKGIEKLNRLVSDRISSIKKQFSDKKGEPPIRELSTTWPDFAGSVIWANGFRQEVAALVKRVADSMFIPFESMPVLKDAEQFTSNLKDYCTRLYKQWYAAAINCTDKMLAVPLMVRGQDEENLKLVLNFDENLLKLFQEVHFFRKLGYSTPPAVNELFMKQTDLSHLRNHVLLVVRDYNTIIEMLSESERILFKDRIRFVDAKIKPGLTKLTWSSKGISEYYVADARGHAAKCRETVEQYLSANKTVAGLCHDIQHQLLVDIEERKVYNLDDFVKSQSAHLDLRADLIRSLHQQIAKILKTTRKVFAQDGIEVQHQWAQYVAKVDEQVDAAMKSCVKKSLQALSTVINGDSKTGPLPAFKVYVVLNDSEINLEPTFEDHQSEVRGIASAILEFGLSLPSLSEELARADRGAAGTVKFANPSKESDGKKLIEQIRAGFDATLPELSTYFSTWTENYRAMWVTAKDKFIERYALTKPSLSKFEADTARYGEVSNNVQKEETLVPIDFLLLDASPLKRSIVDHCQSWQDKFTALLFSMAKEDLNSLIEYLRSTTGKLLTTPKELEEMIAMIQLCESTEAKLRSTEMRFEPINEQFAILERFDFEVPDDVIQLVESLPRVWESFKSAMSTAQLTVVESKVTFKNALLREAEELTSRVTSFREGFLSNGPFNAEVSSTEALAALKQARETIAAIRKAEGTLRTSLEVFDITQEAYREITDTESDLGYLEQLWGIADEYNTSYIEWSATKFMDIDTAAMEEKAAARVKKIVKLGRELKGKDWEMIQFYRNKMTKFKDTMPLIQDLKNPAMRDRHWSQLMEEVGKTFDPHANDFSLETLIGLELDEFADPVAEISGAATKELQIEKNIADIVTLWDETTVEIRQYKDGSKGHSLIQGNTDDLYTLLEDHQVTISTMKASRFVKPFSETVDKWERTLSLILEVLDMGLNVQRQWMYLENIFMGEDIRKQMPKETVMFDKVDSSWKEITTKMKETKYARVACSEEGLFKRLNAMNDSLELIQKALDQYLEAKRQLFPRFYFVSNDDLLEILGQSRNPRAVMPHMLKCFDNIKTLELEQPPQKSKPMDAKGMYSADGEFVPFSKPCSLGGAVETWLTKVEDEMRLALRAQMAMTKEAHKKTKRDKWIQDWAGQLVIAISQLAWTTDTEKALSGGKKKEKVSAKKGLKSMKKKQVGFLKKLIDAIRTVKNKVQKQKLVGLITIEVHSRDVLDKLSKLPSVTIDAFDWLCQLRYYWEKTEQNPDGDTVVRQTNTWFTYMYEYLGNSGRLVITPLTDRCYMTLTTALYLNNGGSPKGPAGTGKTETVKDLGKALAAYVIVVNCSEGLDYKSIGRMFSGLAQTGAWGCFDEFNRINIEVLSVVAQQVLCVLGKVVEVNPDKPETRFVFEGIEIRLRWSIGLFITMNPGYAGRTALPDNLKSMFRPISMMVPDSGMIAEIMLMGVGFYEAKPLAKKIYTCYELSQMQLSKQPHYDFKLRALVAIIRNAGKKREKAPNVAEEEIVYQACLDMNVAKMTADDLPLFLGIMGDLFPGIETPATDYGALKDEVIADLKANSYQPTEFIVRKTLELYEIKTSRHSVMTVGESQGGKSVAFNTLARAMTACQKKDLPWPKVHLYPMNPRSVTLDELYGCFNILTNEWTDGILSSIMRAACADEKPDQKWIVFDGPVQADWIESMNSVMDDNKLLTLINGERISMPDQVSLLFECQDLGVASPATVSRAGFVFFDVNDLGWQPYMDSWCERLPDQTVVEDIRRCVERFVPQMVEFVTEKCTELVPTMPMNKIISLCNLLEILLTEENGIPMKEPSADRSKLIEKWFLFALVWSIGGGVSEQSRKQVDNFLREIEGNFPPKDTVYEYAVDVKSKGWVHWESRLKAGWSFPMDMPFHKVLVPTVDTLRYAFVLDTYLRGGNAALAVGPVGTGKTQMIQAVIDKFDPSEYSSLNINLSSRTTASGLQEIIEARVEKRTKGVYVPHGNKKMFLFIDDLNMPVKGEYGDQPPLELLRQWVDYGVWYDLEKQTQKEVKNMYLCSAMGPPGGGRTKISMRLQSRYSLVNMTFPSDTSIYKIFGTIFSQRLQGFDESVKPLIDQLNKATLQIYKKMVDTMLPTPAKIHYLFNLRDISRVFQGLFRAHKDFHDTSESLLRLWVNEIYRVFGDRLVTEHDSSTFRKFVEEALGSQCNVNFSTVCPDNVMPIFAEFTGNGTVFEDVKDHEKLKLCLDEKLEDYNNTPGYVTMDLVFFMYCMEHVVRISRVIALERGNMLLIGIGGSGRKSAARLAASILEQKIFTIEVTKTYRIIEFREDLKRLYRQAGVENKPTTFLFDDTQVVDEAMLELMNNILSSGEVAKLFPAEELEEIYGDLTPSAKKDSVEISPLSLYRYFIERVRNNLHIVLCMSPVGEAFRNRMRQYPSLINCNTINYFTPWPQEALMAVAAKFMDDVSFEVGESFEPPEEGMSQTDIFDAKEAYAETIKERKSSTAFMFSIIHQSVVTTSVKMEEEIKRQNFVTPINYLELVQGYKALLAEKRKELGDSADKLSNGLEKIDDTRIKVTAMGKELEVQSADVAVFQKECEEFLVIIVQQKKEADEQQKSVSSKAEKIGSEAAACAEMAKAAQADLDEAIPALEDAVQALNSLNKGDISEIKAYTTPPKLVATVLEAVMILRKEKADWATAKKSLGAPDFIKQLIEFDKDNISEATRKRIAKYTERPEFQPDVVGKVSGAARSLCMWVRAMEVYARIFKVVEPKRLALQNAQDSLNAKQAALKKEQDALAEVEARVAKLQADYEAKLKQKEELAEKAALTKLKLERAEQLVSGLAGERTRWDLTVKLYRKQIKLLVGDCLMAAGALSYLGPFISVYREQLVKEVWIKKIKELKIPHSPDFDMATFLAKPVDVRFWNIQGLPADQFSTENGVIVTRGRRWPLMIDPQGQAMKWIKNMEGKRGLKIIDLQMKDFLRTLENAIQFGSPVLLQGIGEDLDPSLDPVLAKSFIKVGGRLMIRLGDKEVDYNPDFKFYLTTKMSNPTYGPDISTKVTIVNFAVVLQGLEEQMLGVTVRRERLDLEEQKDQLVMNIAAGKKKLVDLEDKILDLLANAKGSLLDDVTLLDTLNSSKSTSISVNEQLEDAAKTEIEIDGAREGYRPIANRAAVLFFVLNDIEKIDPMYQFSLDSYITLFNLSITNAKKSSSLEHRIVGINNTHTYAVYRNTCRGLFEKDKLLFSFHLNAKILESQKKLNMAEYNFFLRGGQVLDRSTQTPNPAKEWITESAWDNLTELNNNIGKFNGLVNSIETNMIEWRAWYRSGAPEKQPLPGEWDAACNELQKMLIVRSLRPDRVSIVGTEFVVNTLGQQFVEPPPLDMNAVLADAAPHMPLVFVLSTGVDPTRNLIDLAKRKGMGDRLKNLSLGQGQAPIAERFLEQARVEGQWVFLANCHLSLSWMPRLAKIVDTLEENPPHPDFLLWLSSSPTPEFPISILQAGIKMTTEPPKGLKANQKRLYASLTEDQFEMCHARDKYCKLLGALVFFHAILLERRKFQMLGWNVAYPFNDSDFVVSESILSLYLDEYDDTPWDAMRYLISGVMYGGHVTDDNDRRLMMTYINELFCPEALVAGYKFSDAPEYHVIEPGMLQDYADYITGLPNTDPPQAFGQHPNADISSMIRDNTVTLTTLVSLQPTVVAGGGESNEDKVYNMAGDMEEKIPNPIDKLAAQKLFRGDTNPLTIVLFQEMDRYNALLVRIKAALRDVRKGVKGLVVMSADLEEVYSCMLAGVVPEGWKNVYPSTKALAPWVRDLIERIAMFNDWAVSGAQPKVFWASAFSFPTGFLTAVLQIASRTNSVPIDHIDWEFPILDVSEENVKESPADGVYVKGLFIEGAGWDFRSKCIIEAKPMELTMQMPIIHFKPVEHAKSRAKKGYYSAPCYYYPNRAGEAHWIKQGVALLMSLDT